MRKAFFWGPVTFERGRVKAAVSKTREKAAFTHTKRNFLELAVGCRGRSSAFYLSKVPENFKRTQCFPLLGLLEEH